MEWNTRASHTSNLQTKNFEVWASDLSHQLNTTYNFAQANASTPYSGNDQTIKMHSNTSNRVLSQPLLENTEQSLNYKPVLPKTSVSATGFTTPKRLIDRRPVSSAPLSSVTVQMQDGIAQNPWPNSNIHVFASSAVPGSTVNSVLNIPQTLYMAPVNYSNCPQKNSNCVRTSVYPQTKKSSSFSNRQSTPKTSYHLKGPPASQVSATVPFKPASNHNLNSQQNVSFFINLSGQNNQINGPRSSSAIAMKSQQYTSGHVISTPYTGSTHSYRGAIQIPPVASINPPPPYHAHPVQKSYGHLAQPIANTSNENVQNHQNLVLDQNSAQQTMQFYQKHQPVQSAREINEVGSTANYVNEYKAVDKPANELAKPLIPVLESKNTQILIPEATKTLVQDENLPNSSGNLGDITKDHLIMDLQNVPDLEKALSQLKGLEVEHKLYIAVVKNKKTSDSAHNKNPNVSPFSNNAQNQTFLLPHDAKQVFKAPSQDVVLWESQPFPLASQSSSQICDVPLSTRKEHLYPILKDLLQGTVDEDMLMNITKEKHQNGLAAVQENGSSSTPLVSGGEKCENVVKSNEETSRTNTKTFLIVPNQEPLKGTNNSLGFEQPSRSAMNQSANIPTVPEGGLFNHFRLKKNKILVHLSSSVQNPATSKGSSPSAKTVVKESATTCPEVLHQSKNTSPQTPEKNVTIRTSGSVSDASGLALPVSKAVVTTPEAGVIPKLLTTGNSCTMGRTCSWEELKASLTLWVKNLLPLNGLLRDSTESTVSSSSKDDDKIQQTSENLPNALTQNDQTTTEKSSVASSLGNKLDSISSGLLKGSEPQVAIVAPLVQSKESVQMEVQKKNLSISFKMVPVIEDSMRNLKERISTVPDTDRGISSLETGIAVEKVDSLRHQREAKSMGKNGMVKDETNLTYDCSFLELKKVKSEVSSGDEINCLNPISQECVKSHESDENLLKPGDTAEAELNSSMLQISSVCTLVQGDAFYNSQIANIFNTSPVKSSVKNDDPSEEHVPCSQHNEQPSTLLKGEFETKMTTSAGSILLPSQDSVTKVVAEKPSKGLAGLDMPEKGDRNARNSEEEKSNFWHEDSILSGKKLEQNFSYGGVYRIDLASGDQEFSENQDLFSTAVENGTYAIKNENVKNYMLLEENHAQYCTNSESSVTLLNDQLTELLKEYPNGISDLEIQQKSEIKTSIKLTEREDKEETQSCGQNPSPRDAIDQVKYIRSSKKLKNSENDILIDSEDKDGLSSDNISHIETQQLKHIDDTNATAETTVVKKENETYCCMQAFIASRYAVKPCSCKLAGSVDLNPQKSKNMLELKPKGRESYKTDDRLNNPLQTTVLCPVDSVPSGDQSNKFLKNTETDHQVKKSTLSNRELTPSSFLEKLDPQKPKRASEQERKVLPISEGCHTLKEETNEMDQIYLRENLCSAQILPHLGTKNFKKIAVQPHSKVDSHKRRAGVVAVSKTDRHRHHNLEIKHRRKNEKFKIKHDTSETHMIKGPSRLNKGLKRQMTMERKVLKIQHSVAKNSTNLGSADLVSYRYQKSWHKSASPSEEHFTKQKWESQRDLEKNDTIKPEHSGPSNSEHTQPNTESIKRMNLDKYAYSKERENAWKYKRFLLDNRRIPKVQKQRGLFSSRLKINSFGKEVVQDAHNRDEWSGRSLSEKAASFSKRINKLTLQREQKKSYLNRVSFTETAQESICLKKLEPSPSKSVWRMKSGNVLGSTAVAKTSSSSSLPPSYQKPQMLEFKMCPEILFRASVSEEQATDSKKLPEKDKTPITGTVYILQMS